MDREGLAGFDAAECLELLRALPEGIARLQPDGRVTYLNPAGEDLLGLGPREWAGRNVLEILGLYGGPGRTLPLDLSVVLDHLATGRSWAREEAWLVRADGREVPASYVFAPLSRGAGLGGAVFAFRDLTERRRAERAIHQARVELAAAGKAEAAKAAFLSSMSRDVLAPVDVLVGAAERLVAADLPPSVREEAETVRASARAVLGVLADVLDWTRIEAGALALQPIEFDLRAALGDVVAAQRPAAAAKGLTLDLVPAADGVRRVVGDPGRIRQVAEKILAHAFRATDRGRVVVALETTWRSRAEAILRVRVDHGGANVADFCGGASRDGAPSGAVPTGARSGLALASRLVERMGGALGGETGPDGTSTSWFELRLPVGRPGPRELRAADLRGVRALVVESSEAGRDLISRQLAAAGLRCTMTGSGGQALRLLRAALDGWDPYRLAILSAPLREMDAATLGDLVKGDPRLRDTALVFLASVGEPGDARRLEEIGFAAYLVKPVTDEMLRDALSVVWGATLVRSDPTLVTRHALRDSRIVRLTPDEIRDRALRAPSGEIAAASGAAPRSAR
jgi:PAS domain S-box-containing protein